MCTGVPQSIADASTDHIYGDPYFEGDVVTYTCTLNSSISTTTSCQSDGSWASASLTCPEGKALNLYNIIKINYELKII